jgi:NADPH2:quinone reductase
MRAIVVDRWMEPKDLEVREVPDPQLLPGALEVEVRAAGCNFFDILMVQGRYQMKPPFPFTPGAEIAGVVKRVGDGVRDFAPGDRVLSSAGLGGFAEVAMVGAGGSYKLPRDMSFEEGAALPIIYPTSYAGLVDRGHPYLCLRTTNCKKVFLRLTNTIARLLRYLLKLQVYSHSYRAWLCPDSLLQ